jgi:signal transduction histidine kinase
LKLKLLFAVIFVIFQIFGYLFIKNIRDGEINEILNNSLENNSILLNSILDSFHTDGDIILDYIMDVGDVEETLFRVANGGDERVLRNELYQKLEKRFKNLQSKYGFQKLHFHLPDGTSFLRVHKPNKFGDYLLDIRKSIKMLHEKREIIRGFEEGKRHNTFRNIYPIYRDKIFLGSVEVSFSFSSLRSKAMEVLPHHYTFIVKKRIKNTRWKNYQKSSLSEKFYSHKDCNNSKHTDIELKAISRIDTTLKKEIGERLERFEKFGLYKSVNGQYFNISFIPIESIGGYGSAYFISYEIDSKHIEDEFSAMTQRFIIFFALTLLILYLAYLSLARRFDIQALNSELRERIDTEIQKSRKKDRLILQQSKFSAMAEMMNSIAHQWRQPLNRISLGIINIEEEFLYDELTRENLSIYSENINESLQYLSRVIDDFRDFYKPIEEQEMIDLLHVIKESITYLQGEFKDSAKIEIENLFSRTHMIDYGREFKQVLVNLVTNSLDAIEHNQIKDGEVRVVLREVSGSKFSVSIEDNGGGIPEEIEDRIFEPYFTTKFQSEGTGMGLYVSKITIEVNMGGKLHYSSIDGGSKFIIELYSSSKEKF